MKPETVHTKFTLGFSPCPNDTFIFDALVNRKIDTQGFEFEVHLADVQTLNEWAIAGKLDFSKISYGVLSLLTGKYTVLESGGALGRGVGPLLVGKHPVENLAAHIPGMKIAVPGMHTTGHMLFSMAFPEAERKEFLVFHEIEDAVLSGKADAGVIIHENRFTYQSKGLHKLMDLGEYWEQHTKLPIPLGGIVANKKIDTETALQVDTLIRKSVEYAFSEYPHISEYVQENAQEMSVQVMKQHIDLYVNDFSLWLGEDGKQAVMRLMEVYEGLHPSQAFSKADIFIA